MSKSPRPLVNECRVRLHRALLAVTASIVPFGAHSQSSSRYINAPIPAAAADHRGSTTAIIYPDGVVIGEPGVIIPRLLEGETPDRLFTVVSGRVNELGDSHWDYYQNHYYLRLYSTDPDSGYFADGAPIAVIHLPLPVDENLAPIRYVADAASSSILPDLPTYVIVNSSADYRQSRGYLFVYQFTTSTSIVDQYHVYLPPDVVSYLQSHDSIATYTVDSFMPSTGGIRLGTQETGYGQEGAPLTSVFGSVSQGRAALSISNFTFAIGLRTTRALPDAVAWSTIWCDGTNVNGVAVVANSLSNVVYQLEATSSLVDTSTWNAVTQFQSMASGAPVELPLGSNSLRAFRLRAVWSP